MSGSFSDASATTRVEATSVPRIGTLAPVAPGTSVGRYVLVEEIGRGGMGRVLRAYDPKLQREVALKEVRRDRLGRDGAERLVAEARAMAKLSHPHVVAVFDVEESGGEFMLVMEYVPGTTMRGWLREQSRPWEEVVRRYVAAGRGLVAAHAAGLLHRDFKPSNVLVSAAEHGVVKVTDFGLAKGVDSISPSASVSIRSSTDDLLTESGTVLGTPRYMAPEQHAGHELSAAVDQYALCISLWEALSGEPPFVGDDLVRLKHGPLPPWSNPRVPRRIVDAITRGLAVEPDDRWPSVDDLLAQLTDDPVRRRSRWAWGAGAVLGLATLGVGWSSMAARAESPCSGAEQQLAGIWDDARRDEVQASMLAVEGPYVEAAWIRTGAALDGHAAAWTRMFTDACEATVLRKEQSEAMMDLQMGCLRRARDELGAVTQILASANAKVVQKSHRLVGGLSPLSRCADLDGLAEDVAPPLPEDADAVADARRSLAEAAAARRVVRHDDVRAHLTEAEAVLEGVDYGPLETEVLLERAQLQQDLGEYEDAAQTLDAAIESAARWKQWPLAGNAAALAMDVVGVRLGRPAEGIRYRGLAAGATREEPELRAHMLNNLALVLDKLARYEDAEATHREALQLRLDLGNIPLGVAQSRNNLATVLYGQGRVEEAEQEFRAAAQMREEQLGPDHPLVGMGINNVGTMLEVRDRYAEAEVQYRRALSIFESALGPDHPRAAGARNNLANVLDEQGKRDEAEGEYRRALQAYQQTLGPEHPNVAITLNNIGTVLKARGRLDDAHVEFGRALAILEQAMGTEHPSTLDARRNIAAILVLQGRRDEATAAYREILTTAEAALPEDHPNLAAIRHRLAKLLYEGGAHEEARPLVTEAWTRRQRDDVPAVARGATGLLLARVLWDGGERSRAREMARLALEAFEQAGEEAGVTDTRTWLAEHARP